jgi:hypothetical protein
MMIKNVMLMMVGPIVLARFILAPLDHYYAQKQILNLLDNGKYMELSEAIKNSNSGDLPAIKLTEYHRGINWAEYLCSSYSGMDKEGYLVAYEFYQKLIGTAATVYDETKRMELLDSLNFISGSWVKTMPECDLSKQTDERIKKLIIKEKGE